MNDWLRNNWLWITISLAISIPTGLAIWAIHAPLGNSHISEIIKLSVDFISKLALPAILAIWAVYSENRKSEEQKEQLKEQRRIEDLAIIKEYIDNKMPFAEEFYKRPRDQKASREDMAIFATLWQGLYFLAHRTEYEGRATKFFLEIYGEYKKYRKYISDTNIEEDVRIKNIVEIADEICLNTLLFAYPAIKSEDSFNIVYDTITLSDEEFKKKYPPQESPDA